MCFPVLSVTLTGSDEAVVAAERSDTGPQLSLLRDGWTGLETRDPDGDGLLAEPERPSKAAVKPPTH